MKKNNFVNIQLSHTIYVMLSFKDIPFNRMGLITISSHRYGPDIRKRIHPYQNLVFSSYTGYF